MAHSYSAGLLLYRRHPHHGGPELLIAHMGGPFWARKDEHAWSIPKGEHPVGEDAFAAARREFAEELGLPAPEVDYVDLGTQRLSSGKQLQIWAGEADFDTDTVVSNTFDLEWPPHSGRIRAFPEIDRAAWVTPDLARVKLVASQAVFVDRLVGGLIDKL